MMVNDNIIVQRFFNVKDYNPSARNSIDFHEFMDELLESLNLPTQKLKIGDISIGESV